MADKPPPKAAVLYIVSEFKNGIWREILATHSETDAGDAAQEIGHQGQDRRNQAEAKTPVRPGPTYFVSQLRAGKWRTVLTTKDAAKAYELLARLGANGQLEVHPAHPPKRPSAG